MMEYSIEQIEIKENYNFEYLLEVIQLLNSSSNLSKELNCEANCQCLKLNYNQVGGEFFSSFEIFGIKSKKRHALYSNIEKIINITKQETNENQKNFIKDSIKNISIMINQIISVCEKNLSKNDQFINSIIESSTLCKNEIETNKDDIKKLQSEIEDLKKHNLCNDLKNYFFNTNPKKINKFEIKLRSKEIDEKNKSIENIRMIIKNFGSIEYKIKYNIDFFESIKNCWKSINQKLIYISNNLNNSNEWIFEKMNEILQYINKLKEQLNSISIQIKSLEYQFNISLFNKDANIIN